MDYKALYEAQLKENEKLKSELEFFKKATEVYEDITAGEGGFIDEKKKLKEEVEEWKEVAGEYFIETPSELESWMCGAIHENDEDYSKYMEPLELRQFALKVHNFAYGTEFDDEYIVGSMDFDAIIEKLKKDEKELTDQLEKKPTLKDTLSEAMKENGDWMTRMKRDHEIELRTQKDMVSMYSKKLEKYKVWIENVWDLIYWSEKADEDVRTCEIVESCGYYDNLEYIKNVLVDDTEGKDKDKEVEELKEEEEVEYPRSKPIGQYPTAVDTVEEEESITIDYFKNNPALSRDAVMKFVMEYETGIEPHQSYIDTIKNMTPAQFDLAYWGYKELFNPEKVMNKEKVREIGVELNRRGNIDLMRVSYYLMSWDIKNAGMLIGSYSRTVEFYWDGVGVWKA